MLRVSRLTDYGTLAMTQMALHPERLFTATDLAAALGLGPPTLSKVLKRLGRHDLVRSVRGQHGGYALARPADGITLADIVDALEEQPFGLTECSAQAGICGLEGGCRIRSGWRRVNDVVRAALRDVTLADLVDPPHLPDARPLRMLRADAGRRVTRDR